MKMQQAVDSVVQRLQFFFRECDETAMAKIACIAFANTVWVCVQMPQRHEISQPEASQIVRQSLNRGLASETKAEK